MLIETIIKDNCTWLTPAPEFFLASMEWFNAQGESQEQWPVCLLDNSLVSKPVITSNGISQTYDLTIFFLHNYPAGDAEDLDHNPQIGSARHTAIDSMRQLADNLLQSLIKDTRLYKPTEDITGASIRSVYNFMDMNLDGVQLNLSVKLLFSLNCFSKHNGPKPTED